MGVLSFRIVGFPVAVQPSFWILSLLFGINSGSLVGTVAWMAIVFSSVLVHELGHALAARSAGQQPAIILHLLGGLTTWRPTRELGRMRQVLISLAGPFAGFALGLAAWAALRVVLSDAGDLRSESKAEPGALAYTLKLTVIINFFYGVVNLLPVLPFDGGQVLAAVLGPKRRKLTASISLVGAALSAWLLFRIGQELLAVLFALGGVSTFFSVFRKPTPDPRTLLAVLERGRDALQANQPRQAALIARAVLDATSEPALRGHAHELALWAAVALRDAPAARASLADVRGENMLLDPLLEAAARELEGDAESAQRLLFDARRAGDMRPELAASLVRLMLASRRLDEACVLAQEIVEYAQEDELRRVAAEAAAGGAEQSAAALLARLEQHRANART